MGIPGRLNQTLNSVSKNVVKFEQFINHRHLILFQTIVSLLLLYQNCPIRVECRNTSDLEISQADLQSSGLKNAKFCDFSFRPVFTSNLFIFIAGCMLVLSIHSKSTLANNVPDISTYANCFLLIYIWFLLAAYFFNPIRMSYSYDYNSSTQTSIYSMMRFLLTVSFFILSFPVSLMQFLSTFSINYWSSTNHFFAIYQLNYNWSAIFTIILFSLQCLLLSKFSNDGKSNEGDGKCKIKEIELQCEAINKSTLKDTDQANISNIINKSVLDSKILKCKQKTTSVIRLKKQTGPKPGYLDKKLSTLATSVQERPILLDSPTKPKPVNITKPLTINLTTSPKSIRKQFNVNRDTQTVKSKPFSSSFKVKETQTDVKSFIEQTTQTEKYMSESLPVEDAYKDQLKYLEVSKNEDIKTTLSSESQSSQTENAINLETSELGVRFYSALDITEHKDTQTTLSSESQNTQTEDPIETETSEAGVQFSSELDVTENKDTQTTLSSESQNTQTENPIETETSEIGVQFFLAVDSKSSQTSLSVKSQSSQKDDDKQYEFEHCAIHEQDHIDILPDEIKLKDSSTQIQIVTQNQSVQIDNTPTSYFTYDKSIQCNLEKDDLHKNDEKQQLTNCLDKNTQTDIILYQLGECLSDDKEIQTLVNSNHFSESLSKMVHDTDTTKRIEEVAFSITKLTNYLSKDTEPIKFKAPKAQNNVWYVSLRSDLFLSLSYDMLAYKKIMTEELNSVANINNNNELNITNELMDVMKTYSDNYNRLSTCFEDDKESDDESFLNGFRL